MTNKTDAEVNSMFTINMASIVPWAALEHSSSRISEKNFSSDNIQIDIHESKIVNKAGTIASYFVPTDNNYVKLTLNNNYVHGNSTSGTAVSLITGDSNLNNFGDADATDFINKLHLVKVFAYPVNSYDAATENRTSSTSNGVCIMDKSSKIHVLNHLKNTLNLTPITNAFHTQDNIYTYVKHHLDTYVGTTDSSAKVAGSGLLAKIRNLGLPINGSVSAIKAHVEALYPEIVTLFQSIQGNRTPNPSEIHGLKSNETSGQTAVTLAAWKAQGVQIVLEDPMGTTSRLGSTNNLWEAMWRWSVWDYDTDKDTALPTLNTLDRTIDLGFVTYGGETMIGLQKNYLVNITRDNAADATIHTMFNNQTSSNVAHTDLDTNGIQFKGLLKYFGREKCISQKVMDKVYQTKQPKHLSQNLLSSTD